MSKVYSFDDENYFHSIEDAWEDWFIWDEGQCVDDVDLYIVDKKRTDYSGYITLNNKVYNVQVFVNEYGDYMRINFINNDKPDDIHC